MEHGPQVIDLMSIPLQWPLTRDPEFPYSSSSQGRTLRLRLNDFPDEKLYSLMLADEEITSFDEWPKIWSRPNRLAEFANLAANEVSYWLGRLATH